MRKEGRPMGMAEDFFQEHLEYIGRGDVDGLLRDHYHDECELITFEFVLKGKEALKKYLTEDNPAKMGKVVGMETTHLVGSDDVVMFTAKVTGEKIGSFYARDAFYLKDGKIFRQIAMTLPPDVDCGGGWAK